MSNSFVSIISEELFPSLFGIEVENCFAIALFILIGITNTKIVSKINIDVNFFNVSF